MRAASHPRSASGQAVVDRKPARRGDLFRTEPLQDIFKGISRQQLGQPTGHGIRRTLPGPIKISIIINDGLRSHGVPHGSNLSNRHRVGAND